MGCSSVRQGGSGQQSGSGEGDEHSRWGFLTITTTEEERMRTPIFDELAARFPSVSAAWVSRNGTAAENGQTTHDGGRHHNGSDRAHAADTSDSCNWCGQPISDLSQGKILTTHDPNSGDEVSLTACCSTHLDYLRTRYDLRGRRRP
jgi:hypothetical protein